jgi:CheY-like chemotaxis protein
MFKVLVIDDEENSRLLLVTLLKHAGHVPLEAADAVTGLRIIREHRPDLVVTDLALPGVHGAAFLRDLRADAEIAETKVALYTATAPDDALRDFMALMRIEHAIPKPAEPDEILRAIAAALRP